MYLYAAPAALPVNGYEVWWLARANAPIIIGFFVCFGFVLYLFNVLIWARRWEFFHLNCPTLKLKITFVDPLKDIILFPLFLYSMFKQSITFQLYFSIVTVIGLVPVCGQGQVSVWVWRFLMWFCWKKPWVTSLDCSAKQGATSAVTSICHQDWGPVFSHAGGFSVFHLYLCMYTYTHKINQQLRWKTAMKRVPYKCAQGVWELWTIGHLGYQHLIVIGGP